jgi:hypothetical protein
MVDGLALLPRDTAGCGRMFLDRLHRAGNVHDSNGSIEYIRSCIESIQARLSLAVDFEQRAEFVVVEMASDLHQSWMQLDLFKPADPDFELKVIVTNKRFSHSRPISPTNCRCEHLTTAASGIARQECETIYHALTPDAAS